MPACARVPGRMKGSHVARGSSRVSGRLPGALHRAGDQILQDENRDVIRHQGNQNFVSAEPCADEADEARPHARRNETQYDCQRQKKKKRKRTDPRARSRQKSQPCGRRSADDEASFKAEVAETRAPAHNRAQRDQRQRRGPHQRIAESAQRSEGLVKKREVCLQRARAIGAETETR